jgi:3-(3-hydroxy-phenyl)propionate hydroxylase
MKNAPPCVSRNPMPDKANRNIIIVGAGPVGLVIATLLVEQGIPVVLIETCNELAHDLRASTFHPPTLDML